MVNIDQGRGATFDDFLTYVEGLTEEPMIGHGTIAVFDREAHWQNANDIADGTLVVVTDTVPGQRHGTVREAFGTKRVSAEIDRLKPLVDNISPAEYLRAHLRQERGDNAGNRKFYSIMSDYRKLVKDGTIPSIDTLTVYRPVEEALSMGMS